MSNRPSKSNLGTEPRYTVSPVGFWSFSAYLLQASTLEGCRKRLEQVERDEDGFLATDTIQGSQNSTGAVSIPAGTAQTQQSGLRSSTQPTNPEHSQLVKQRQYVSARGEETQQVTTTRAYARELSGIAQRREEFEKKS